jgi:hypothetical protein
MSSSLPVKFNASCHITPLLGFCPIGHMKDQEAFRIMQAKSNIKFDEANIHHLKGQVGERRCSIIKNAGGMFEFMFDRNVKTMELDELIRFLRTVTSSTSDANWI